MILKLVKVTGESLSPNYKDGDFVLVAKIPFLLQSLKRGDCVVFDHEIYGTLIKVIDRLDFDKQKMFVKGENINSVDSSKFGSISFTDIMGKVIWHISKPSK